MLKFLFMNLRYFIKVKSICKKFFLFLSELINAFYLMSAFISIFLVNIQDEEYSKYYR